MNEQEKYGKTQRPTGFPATALSA